MTGATALNKESNVFMDVAIRIAGADVLLLKLIKFTNTVIGDAFGAAAKSSSRALASGRAAQQWFTLIRHDAEQRRQWGERKSGTERDN